MRGVLDDSLPDTAVVQTSTWVSDGGGGGTTSWAAVGTYSCRLAPVTSTGEAEDADSGARVMADVDRVLTLPATTTITTNDQVVVGAQTFRVSAVYAPRSWEISRRVKVSEIV